MASIHRREWADSAGKTQVRWDVRYRDPAGKEKQESKKTEREAKARAAVVETEKARGAYVDPRAGKITFRSFAQEWFVSKGYRPSTAQAVDQRLRVHVFPVLGDLPLGKIKAMTIRGWLSGLKGAESSKNTVFIHVNEIFTAAVDEQIIHTNPCQAKSVKRPRAPKEKVTVWTPEVVDAIHGALDDRYAIVAEVGSRLGLRQGEIFGLSPEDVDFQKGIVHVRRQVRRLPTAGTRIFDLPKYDKPRTVPLFPGARKALAAYLLRHPAREVTLPWGHPETGEPTTVALIVTTAQGLSVDASRFNSEVWHKALTAAGVERVPHKTGVHALRHYFASACLACGYSIPEVAEFLGHADGTVTLQTYGHPIRAIDETTRRKNLDAFHDSRGISVGSTTGRTGLVGL